MPDSTTPNYGWAYPTVNADADTWGTTLNNAILGVDSSLKSVATAACQNANNLSDLANASAARTNLGLGDVATHPASDFVPTGTACLKSNNLGDVSSVSSARGNLGLGSAATVNITVSSSAPSGGNNGDVWIT